MEILAVLQIPIGILFLVLIKDLFNDNFSSPREKQKCIITCVVLFFLWFFFGSFDDSPAIKGLMHRYF
jgi:hypothetical protein